MKSNGNLEFIDKDGVANTVNREVDKFYFDGYLAIQKGNNIAILSNFGKVKYELLDTKYVIVGLFHNELLLQKGKKVYEFHISSKSDFDDKFRYSEIYELSDYEVLKGIMWDGEKYLTITSPLQDCTP